MAVTTQEPQELVARGYDRAAEQYARLEGETQWPRMRWLGDLLARLPAGSRVLDLGCGSGIPATKTIAERHTAVGVDISARQVELARANVPAAQFHQAPRQRPTPSAAPPRPARPGQRAPRHGRRARTSHCCGMTVPMDPLTAAYVEQAATRLAGVLGGQLVGNYLHGSAVLGGFTRARSDIDLLAVTASALTGNLKRQLAVALSHTALPCPAVGLELSVVTHATALAPVPTPPFELHLATATGPHGTAKVVDGRGHPGDPDLLLHFAVCRDHGRQLGHGPPPPAVFARSRGPGCLQAWQGSWCGPSGTPRWSTGC
jgi:hypothetical protein